MSFTILTDTSANLPDSFLRDHAVGLVPFRYCVDGQEATCTETGSFDGKAFYNALRGGAAVTTSQVSPGTYRDVFIPLLSAGQDILFVGMSSGISGSYHSAEMAAEELRLDYPQRKIRLVDTLAASLGEGLLVHQAVLCRDKGLTLDHTADRLLDLRHRICQVFTVEDLKYLKRGGRLSNLAAVVGTVLNIKPLLTGNTEGQIVAYAKVRGRRKSIEGLAEKYRELAQAADEPLVGIAHGDCEADAQLLIDLLNASEHPPKEIMSVCYEPVTGSHVGPGTIALFFEGTDHARFC